MALDSRLKEIKERVRSVKSPYYHCKMDCMSAEISDNIHNAVLDREMLLEMVEYLKGNSGKLVATNTVNKKLKEIAEKHK